jgi:hypothetical protein
MEPRTHTNFNSTHSDGLDGAATKSLHSQRGNGVQCLKVTMFRGNVAVCTRVENKGDRFYIREGGMTGYVSNGVDSSV